MCLVLVLHVDNALSSTGQEYSITYTSTREICQAIFNLMLQNLSAIVTFEFYLLALYARNPTRALRENEKQNVFGKNCIQNSRFWASFIAQFAKRYQKVEKQHVDT